MAFTDLPELTCQELVEWVTDYLEGALSPERRARFEAHISGCDACTAYLEQMRETIAALGRLPAGSVKVRDMEALLEHFRRSK